MRKAVYLFCLSLILSSCSVSPQKIEYGKDMCTSCDMTIVDKTHAAQYVTNKGRAYKFDAIECLLNDLKEKDETTMAFVLVTDFTTPAQLINASEAVYLISEEIKSPMGANLSAFSNKNSIVQKGTQYNWKEINQYFNKK